ncbi:MAG: restriction endonuclease subunit S [Lachnoclostridium sp.]|nr:restriction endonuclease subunit S [Lachnospira sp.]MCM1247987.1 restriction endonuclease subunit S [Lachnoclostridium sp.]
MRKIKLGDILDIKRGTSLSGKFYAEAGGKIRLTLGNFNYPLGGFKENTSKKNIYFSGNVKEEFILKKGDIITPLTEQVSGLLGETARIPEDNLYIQSGDIGLVIPNEKVLNRLFAYYLLSSPIVKKQLDSAAQQTKIRHTSPEKIKDCEIWLPDMKHQEYTGVLLDAINDKIKNNNKINIELESMTKTIYDYWFLQFEFPNEEGKPYKSSGGKMIWDEELKKEIPEGWKVKQLKDVESNIITGKTPSTKDKANYNGEIPFITIGDIRGNMHIAKTEQTLSQKGADSQRGKYIPSGSICVTCIASPGLVAFATKTSQTNQQINSIICNKNYNRLYLYFSILDYFKYSSGAKTGNTFANMSKEDFLGIKLIYPTVEILERFDKRTKDIYELILTTSKENQELISLRDFLLPLLMNGQIGFRN